MRLSYQTRELLITSHPLSGRPRTTDSGKSHSQQLPCGSFRLLYTASTTQGRRIMGYPNDSPMNAVRPDEPPTTEKSNQPWMRRSEELHVEWNVLIVRVDCTLSFAMRMAMRLLPCRSPTGSPTKCMSILISRRNGIPSSMIIIEWDRLRYVDEVNGL